MTIALIEPGTPASQGVLRLLGLLPEEDTALLELTETGVPLAQLALLTEIGLTKTEIQALVIPARTMSHRKAGTGRLNREESDRCTHQVLATELGSAREEAYSSQCSVNQHL